MSQVVDAQMNAAGTVLGLLPSQTYYPIVRGLLLHISEIVDPEVRAVPQGNGAYCQDIREEIRVSDRS